LFILFCSLLFFIIIFSLLTRATPGLSAEVNTEVGDRGLGRHGFLATTQ